MNRCVSPMVASICVGSSPGGLLFALAWLTHSFSSQGVICGLNGVFFSLSFIDGLVRPFILKKYLEEYFPLINSEFFIFNRLISNKAKDTH